MPHNGQVDKSHAQWVQSENANKTHDGPNTSCIPHPEGLQCAPPYASTVTSVKQGEMHCQQHEDTCPLQLGEGMYFIDSLNFRQGSLDSLVRETPKETLKITTTISKGRTASKKGDLPLQVHEIMGKI